MIQRSFKDYSGTVKIIGISRERLAYEHDFDVWIIKYSYRLSYSVRSFSMYEASNKTNDKIPILNTQLLLCFAHLHLMKYTSIHTIGNNLYDLFICETVPDTLTHVL